MASRPLSLDLVDRVRHVTGVETATLADERAEGLPNGGTPPPLPEPGQVVEVRGSTWAVANIQAQGLPRSPADDSSAHLSHVIELQSLDEDRLVSSFQWCGSWRSVTRSRRPRVCLT